MEPIMQVILTKDVDTLGATGDIVKVNEGFAQNYLFPKKSAVRATKGALKDLEARMDQVQQKAEKKFQDDTAKAKKIEDLDTITLEANAGETGKLYGTITTKELANVIKEKTDLNVERRNLNLDNPINKVGDYTLHVKISARVSAEVKIKVNPIATDKGEFVLEDAFSDEPDFEFSKEY